MPETRGRIAIAELAIAIGAAAAPLAAFTDFSGRTDRPGFWAAATVAVAGLATARIMDWLVFGAGPGRIPLFFVAIAGGIAAITLPALTARRLRDAGSGRRAMLLALVPMFGWALLARILLAPSVTPRRSVRLSEK